MDVKNLETFVMVNELKSFTLAAGRLGYTQSTVSFQIKQLEKELSIPLFERIGHTVTLTNEGEKLLPLAQQILRLALKPATSAATPPQRVWCGSPLQSPWPAGNFTAVLKIFMKNIPEYG